MLFLILFLLGLLQRLYYHQLIQESKLDKKKREVSLSIKALEEKESKEALKKYGSEDSGMKLKDILGPLINKKKKKDN